MKTTYLFNSIIVILLFFGISCTKVEPIEVDASFTIENSKPYKAGSEVVFKVVGKGEMFAIYPGDEGHVYGDSGAFGLAVNQSIVAYTYNRAGTYNVVCIATSYGDWAEDVNQTNSTQKITVIDDRTGIKKFKIRKPRAKISIDNEKEELDMIFKSGADLNNVVVEFELYSPDAVISVGNVVLESKVTAVNIIDGMIFKIVAPDGNVAEYKTTVIVE